MATESRAGAEHGLPFEEPLQDPIDQAEPIKLASDEPAEISLQQDADCVDHPAQLGLDELMGYLAKGVDSLKGLNLQGFEQIYSIFLTRSFFS